MLNWTGELKMFWRWIKDGIISMVKKKPSGRLDEMALGRCSDKQAEQRATLIASQNVYHWDKYLKKKQQQHPAAVACITISNMFRDFSSYKEKQILEQIDLIS